MGIKLHDPYFVLLSVVSWQCPLSMKHKRNIIEINKNVFVFVECSILAMTSLNETQTEYY